jgi:hypothetical protein
VREAVRRVRGTVDEEAYLREILLETVHGEVVQTIRKTVKRLLETVHEEAVRARRTIDLAIAPMSPGSPLHPENPNSRRRRWRNVVRR